MRSLMTSGDRTRLVSLAKTEASPDLRGEAIQQLGAMRASAELTELYQTEQSADMKKRIINGIYASGNAKTLVDLARQEKNADLKKEIVMRLANMKSKDATDYLLELLK